MKQLHHIRRVSALVVSRNACHATRNGQSFAFHTVLSTTPSGSRVGASLAGNLLPTNDQDRRTRTFHGRPRSLTTARASSDDLLTNIDRLSELAQIKLTEDEKKEIGPQIERIVDWMGQLNNVDVEGVRPSMRGGDEGDEEHVDTAWLRPDVVADDPKDIDGRVGVLQTNEEGFVPVQKGVFR